MEIASFPDADKLRVFLTDEERVAAAGKPSGTLRMRFEIARGLRRKMLSAATGVNPGDCRFAEDGENKPRLMGAPEWDFNLSHAGEYAACVVARGQVGIDIEKIRPVRDMESIVARYFHPDEAAAWRALPSCLREEAFFVLWSAREAAMKCTGRGLAKGLSITRVDPSIVRTNEASARVGDTELTVRRWEAPRGYVAVVALGAAT